MKSINIILFALISFTFLSYYTVFGQEGEVGKFIESIENKINQAVLAGDYETVMSYFTDDIVVVPIFHPPIESKETYREEVKKLEAKGVKYQSISGTPSKIWVCDNLVYEMGTFGMSFVTNESPKPTAYYGSYFQIWEKQTDESYKLKYMISNLDFNPFEK